MKRFARLMGVKIEQILVTGAEGFIGSHLVERLLKDGYRVRALVLYNSDNSVGWLKSISAKANSDFEVVLGDVRDQSSMVKAMHGCEAVMHLAALISIQYSYVAPKSYVETNVLGTLNVLEAAMQCSLKQVIHTSTSEVYGSPIYVPIDEDHPLQGQSPYSASKIAADQLAFSYYSSFDSPVKIVRPFNTYGPRQSTRAVIPTIIRQLLAGDGGVALGGLETTRNFNYIDDTVNGFISVLKSPNGFGEITNFGSNYEISIKDLAALIAEILNKDLNIIVDPKRLRPKNSEVSRLSASNMKAQKLYNWSPVYQEKEGIKLGLERTVDWFAENTDILDADNIKYHL